jgi:hypothetical protein
MSEADDGVVEIEVRWLLLPSLLQLLLLSSLLTKTTWIVALAIF